MAIYTVKKKKIKSLFFFKSKKVKLKKKKKKGEKKSGLVSQKANSTVNFYFLDKFLLKL